MGTRQPVTGLGRCGGSLASPQPGRPESSGLGRTPRPITSGAIYPHDNDDDHKSAAALL